jgi:hypothetical protein
MRELRIHAVVKGSGITGFPRLYISQAIVVGMRNDMQCIRNLSLMFGIVDLIGTQLQSHGTAIDSLTMNWSQDKVSRD